MGSNLNSAKIFIGLWDEFPSYHIYFDIQFFLHRQCLIDLCYIITHILQIVNIWKCIVGFVSFLINALSRGNQHL